MIRHLANDIISTTSYHAERSIKLFFYNSFNNYNIFIN